MAKATAGEADVPFFSLSGSDFVKMFVGVGARQGTGSVQTSQGKGTLYHCLLMKLMQSGSQAEGQKTPNDRARMMSVKIPLSNQLLR